MEVEITGLAKKGYGTARLGKKVCEVAHTVPGDRVLIEPKKGGEKGRLLQVLRASADRVEPACAHVGLCGGCSWQQMALQAQEKEKERRVEEAFGIAPRPILGAADPWRYRNKMEFTFSENRAGERFLGLMIAQAEPYVFHLHECHIAPASFALFLGKVRSWWHETGLPAYFPPDDRGTLRYLTLRANRKGDRLILLNVSGRPEFAPKQEHLDAFKALLSPGDALFLRVIQNQKGAPTQFFEMHLAGPDHLIEELCIEGVPRPLTFKISPSSFFQPNTAQAERLYGEALKEVRGELVYDLYCGTGTLGMAASFRARRVVGIELLAEAVLDAKENLERNRIENVTIHQGDVGQVLASMKGEKPDVILLDPPRAGLSEEALFHVKKLQAKQIIYISCNPLTQADNCRELVEAGYRVRSLQPVDQFPHTYHIENIAVLER
jgi:23S rRNA (uracil1939-C5)-methyltransferase